VRCCEPLLVLDAVLLCRRRRGSLTRFQRGPIVDLPEDRRHSAVCSRTSGEYLVLGLDMPGFRQLILGVTASCMHMATRPTHANSARTTPQIELRRSAKADHVSDVDLRRGVAALPDSSTLFIVRPASSLFKD
jgi:hypothetical protein